MLNLKVDMYPHTLSPPHAAQGKITVSHTAANFSLDETDVQKVQRLFEGSSARVLLVQLEIPHHIVAQVRQQAQCGAYAAAQ